VAYDHDLVTGRGKIRKRNKGGSRQFRGAYGHPAAGRRDLDHLVDTITSFLSRPP
jgi:hypothetical protein